MGRQTPSAVKLQKEMVWRERLARHAASGQSVIAFCRSEAVAEGTFYAWRTRLLGRDADAAPTPPAIKASSFIDLGSVKNLGVSDAPRRCDESPDVAPTGIEVRIDLGGGVVLTITRP